MRETIKSISWILVYSAAFVSQVGLMVFTIWMSREGVWTLVGLSLLAYLVLTWIFYKRLTKITSKSYKRNDANAG